MCSVWRGAGEGFARLGVPVRIRPTLIRSLSTRSGRVASHATTRRFLLLLWQGSAEGVADGLSDGAGSLGPGCGAGALESGDGRAQRNPRRAALPLPPPRFAEQQLRARLLVSVPGRREYCDRRFDLLGRTIDEASHSPRQPEQEWPAARDGNRLEGQDERPCFRRPA